MNMSAATDEIDSGILLERLATEAAATHEMLSHLQGALSEILSEGNISAVASQRLQALDHATQRVENLERVLRLIAASRQSGVSRRAVFAAVSLRDVAMGLIGVVEPGEPANEPVSADDGDDAEGRRDGTGVTWL